MTPTGRERTTSLLLSTDDARIENSYAPYDLPDAVNRFLDRNQPRILVIIDTELWPNTIAACRKRGIPVALVNGRMSEKSARGYASISLLSKPMMAAISCVAAQTLKHQQRFIELGVPASRVALSGSIKFDAEHTIDHKQKVAAARSRTAGRPVIIGASTHEGEEAALLASFALARKVDATLLLVLAPRHTHRCSAVRDLVISKGFQLMSFTSGEKLSADTAVFLIDVMGELEPFFAVASLAFIGGSLVPVGGHNLLEAVREGTPVLMGPELRNVEDIAGQFIDEDAMLVVADADELSEQMRRLIADEALRDAMAGRANKVLQANQGALDRVVAMIQGTLN